LEAEEKYDQEGEAGDVHKDEENANEQDSGNNDKEDEDDRND